MTQEHENECSKFEGRLRHICEGTASLPLVKINAYRQTWGLAPLTELKAPLDSETQLTNRSLNFNPVPTPLITEGVKKSGCGGCGGSRSLPSTFRQATEGVPTLSVAVT